MRSLTLRALRSGAAVILFWFGWFLMTAGMLAIDLTPDHPFRTMAIVCTMVLCIWGCAVYFATVALVGRD